MVELWYAILSLMLTTFAITAGWDFGAGALHMIVAKTQPERRSVFAAIGPLWHWNEVWLVSSGGVLFVAFPAVLATAFSGFYLALFLILWSLILRGISIEAGGLIADPLWEAFWDFTFAVSNMLLALLFGTALGNVLRGVPIEWSGKLSMSLFTNFGVRGNVGILDWYTLSVAVFTFSMLLAHGAVYLALKSEGSVRERSWTLAKRLWPIVLVLFIIVSAETWYVRPEFYAGMRQRPLAWLARVAVLAGAAFIVTGLRKQNEKRAFAGSCLCIGGLLVSAAASVFPVILNSTISPEYSLDAYRSASSEYGLKTAIMWWPFALVLSMIYFSFVYRYYRGKVKPPLSGSENGPY